MINLMLVDDELLTLQMLERIIDWEELGISIAGKALSAEKALKIAKNERIDIMITDIVMPQTDGLELIREFRKNCKDTPIVILSSYNEFEYAQKAIEYHVNGYLLKPVDEIKLKQVMCKIVEEIAFKRSYIENGINNPPEEKEAYSLEELLSQKEISEEEKNEYISKIKRFIAEKYAHSITLDDISRHVALSKAYMCYLFKKIEQKRIWDYLIQIRMEKAKEYLQSSKFAVQDIAQMVGYENPNYFSRLFKKYCGEAPAYYRKTSK